MAKPTQKKLPALRLTLGGAPATPHVLVGLPGFYFTDDFTPVGGEGELTLAEAKALDKAPGCAVELCYVAPRTIAGARKRQAELRVPALQAARELAREDGVADAERELANDQAAAANGETDQAAVEAAANPAPDAGAEITSAGAPAETPDDHAGDGVQEV